MLEIAFHGALFALFFRLHRAQKMKGRLFAIYMISYGVFRTLVEPWRETLKARFG